jgi:hypothetical protein
MEVRFGNKIAAVEVAEGLDALINPFYAQVILDDGRRIEIILPEDFITDYCSVPRLPFAYMLFGGIAKRAGAVHDGLYSAWTKIVVVDMETREPFIITREWADEVFKAALKACGVGVIRRQLMYSGVRVGGWKYYKKPYVDLASMTPSPN